MRAGRGGAEAGSRKPSGVELYVGKDWCWEVRDEAQHQTGSGGVGLNGEGRGSGRGLGRAARLPLPRPARCGSRGHACRAG